MSPKNTASTSYKSGIASAVLSYCFWGLIPLYWALLKGADNVEILAHRIVWSLFFILLMLIVKGLVAFFHPFDVNRQGAIRRNACAS